jgi:hypothetical protein
VTADLVWNFADGVMGLMALTSLIAIGLLSGIAFRLLKDYTAQRRDGRDLQVSARQARKHRDHLHPEEAAANTEPTERR